MLWPHQLTRVKINYFSGVAEYHPLVLVARHLVSEWNAVKNTIESLDTLNFVKNYEVAHFGGKEQSSTTSIELLLTPQYRYELITDSDMALDYISAVKLDLPTK